MSIGPRREEEEEEEGPPLENCRLSLVIVGMGAGADGVVEEEEEEDGLNSSFGPGGGPGGGMPGGGLDMGGGRLRTEGGRLGGGAPTVGMAEGADTEGPPSPLPRWWWSPLSPGGPLSKPRGGLEVTMGLWAALEGIPAPDSPSRIFLCRVQ